MGITGYFKRKAKHNRTMGRIALQVMIPVILLFFGVIYVLFQTISEARYLVYRYLEDTAKLNVEQLNTEIVKINYEIITKLKKENYNLKIPPNITPKDSEYYDLLNTIMEENRSLKIRYNITSSFYVFFKHADLLVSDSGSVFSTSQKTKFTESLMNELDKIDIYEQSSYSEWKFFGVNGKQYLYSHYLYGHTVMGCVINIDDLFKKISISRLGYEAIPFLYNSEQKTILSQSNTNDKIKQYIDEQLNEAQKVVGKTKNNTLYKYSINGITKGDWDFHILVLARSGILEKIMSLQIILVVLSVGIILGSGIGISIYKRRVLSPMKRFVNNLKNMEEEQILNENGSNNILELEVVNKEFKEMLRKIQLLKIDVYEKELSQKKIELDYAQEKIKPHFYLNCLNLIHKMAEADNETKIVDITQSLSNYMRYVMQGSSEKRHLYEEISFIRSYIDIQNARYGKEAFSFEIIMEDGLEQCLIPPLIIQTFVENSMTHAVSLDQFVEITIYIAEEWMEKEKMLYICISDTGTGFSDSILNALEKEKPIYYDNRNHIGIENSIKRLKLIYGQKFKYHFFNMGAHGGAVVELTIPFN